MKFSENWLRQHVSTDISRQVLCDTLTSIGLEVESITDLGQNLEHSVVAKIIEALPHPQADKLQICTVDIGGEEPVQIVCGAPNARAGLVAPLAKIGAKIGEIIIKAAKLRGVASNGMLCSAKELGLSEEASGLLELPSDAAPGTPLADYLALPDASIEIKLTPNRADCFSVRGIAFDVAAATASTVTPFAASPVLAQSSRECAIELHADTLAPRYVGRVIEGVNPSAPTPIWMAERLRRSGVRPVSLLVDITQYVMLELGQPMHAYDFDTLHGPIGVRRARNGEKLKLLDGREVNLDDSFLLITDADRAIGLAGLMGGWETRVSDHTRNVFLEAAHFAPEAILGRGRKLGLHTDAGHRFERGVDPHLPRAAMEYATALVLELADGTASVISEAVIPDHLPQPPSIYLRRERITRLLGLTIPDADIERILLALDMQLESVAEGWQVKAPSRRFDMAIEEDVIEELARIYGYAHIPTTLPHGATRISVPTETRLDEGSVRRHLASRDMLETINYAFIDGQKLKQCGLDENWVTLANPLSAELGVMRPMLLPGLVATLARNLAHQATRVRLFEIGRVFTPAAEPDAAPQETLRLAAVVCGNALADHWDSPSRMVDFYDLKGDLESLAAATKASLEFRPQTRSFAHPQRSASIWRDNQCIGWIGQLHPRLPVHSSAAVAQLLQPVFAFELDLDPLLHRPLPQMQAISKFPSVRRDLALVVDEHLPWSVLAATVRQAAGPLLNELHLFDHYSGQGVQSGHKSVAIGLILQDKSRTLTANDCADVEAAVLAAVAREHSATIRS